MKLPSALPRLTGRWLAAYRVLWILLFISGLFAATWGEWTDQEKRDRAHDAMAGVGLTSFMDGLEPMSAAAAAAGVRPKSRLVAIDGVPATWNSSGQAEAARRLEGPDGSTVTVTLRSADGAVRDFVLTRSREHLRAADAVAPMPRAARSLLYWAMDVFESALILVIVALMFWRRPNDPVAALFSVGVLGMTAGSNTALLAPSALGLSIANGVVSGAAFCFFLAMLVFPGGRFDSRWTWIGAALAVVWAVLSLSSIDAHPLIFPMSLTILVVCILAIGRRYFRAPAGVERQQIKWTLLGVVFFLGLSLVSLGIDEAAARSDEAQLRMLSAIVSRIVASTGTAALFGGLLISILRHRLYDADVAISRSVSAGALTLAVVAIFAGAEKAIEIFGEQYLGGSLGNMAGAIAAGLAAVMILPLHNGLSRWTEQRFQGSLVRMRQHLPHDMDEMRDADTVACLSDAAMRQAAAGVRAIRGAVLVREGEAWVVPAQSEPAAVAWRPDAGATGLIVDRRDPDWPLRLALPAGGGAVAGWLLLGPRPDGSLPGKEDREALEAIAEPVGRAIRVAQRREQDAAAARARFERLEASVRALRRRLGSPSPAAVTK
ncbi:MAG TPA: hypothetical protein VFF66_12255 [Brevundimonas sp.]|nr:hypothetical protein [Brevundimonas sp.]